MQLQNWKNSLQIPNLRLQHLGQKQGTREYTRLDIMAYLDPASNPRSKPKRLGAANCKSSTSDKLQTLKTIFGISCKF